MSAVRDKKFPDTKYFYLYRKMLYWFYVFITLAVTSFINTTTESRSYSLLQKDDDFRFVAYHGKITNLVTRYSIMFIFILQICFLQQNGSQTLM